jgi:Zn-dependent M16 (insulinase) family peptidase
MDDDGLPHALEHLVFFGSEAHPRGYLDAFASRMMCSDVNAYTKNDHTWYYRNCS